jgi:hypothetical protein
LALRFYTKYTRIYLHLSRAVFQVLPGVATYKCYCVSNYNRDNQLTKFHITVDLSFGPNTS